MLVQERAGSTSLKRIFYIYKTIAVLIEIASVCHLTAL